MAVLEENANSLVPLEPNFDDDIDNTDWLKILCEVVEENKGLIFADASYRKFS